MNFDEARMDYSSNEAEPMFNDASLSAPPSTVGVEKLSTQEENSESGSVASNTFHSAAISIRGPLHDAFHGAEDQEMNLTGANHFDKLPSELQFKIIELCMPNRDAWRRFEICRAPSNLIYLKEKERTHDTQIPSVSKLFRNIYLKHLPIMLPSFTDEPIYIHKDTTVVLDMSEQGFCDLAECSSRRPPAFFSQIRHLAIPLLLFGSPPDDFCGCTVSRRICRKRVDAIVFWGIFILACSKLQSLTAIHAHITHSEFISDSVYISEHHDFMKPRRILESSLQSLQCFLHLQHFIGIYSYTKPTYNLIAGRNMNKNWNIGEDSLGDREDLKINKPNVERILHTEIDSFMSYFTEDPSLAAAGRKYLWSVKIINLNTYRALLRSSCFTLGTERLFKADEKFEDNENNKKVMEKIRTAYELYQDSNEDNE